MRVFTPTTKAETDARQGGKSLGVDAGKLQTGREPGKNLTQSWRAGQESPLLMKYAVFG